MTSVPVPYDLTQIEGLWSKIGDEFALRLAIEGPGGLTVPYRLMFLTMARADRRGTARFQPCEVRDLLKVSASTVSHGIVTAMQIGLLEGGSHVRQLQLPFGRVARGIHAERSVKPARRRITRKG